MFIHQEGGQIPNHAFGLKCFVTTDTLVCHPIAYQFILASQGEKVGPNVKVNRLFLPFFVRWLVKLYALRESQFA